jgi:hypothetical protein
MAKRGEIPGLKRRPNDDGTVTWYWVAAQISSFTRGFKPPHTRRNWVGKEAFRPRTVRLWRGVGDPSIDEQASIKTQAEDLNAQLVDWLANPKRIDLLANRSRKRRRIGFIYFLRGSIGIKIGFTIKVSQRVKQLQTGSAERLALIGTISGTPAYETLLKRRFAGLQISGEWFREAGALTEFLMKTFPEHRSDGPSERRQNGF